MGWLSEFLTSGLQSIPLNAVLRERVALAEQKFKDMETENEMLKERVTALATENESLRKRVAESEAYQQREKPEIMKGCYFFGSDNSKLYCVACYETQGKKHPMAEQRRVGYRCAVCKSLIPY